MKTKLAIVVAFAQVMYAALLFAIHAQFPDDPGYLIAVGITVPILTALFAESIGNMTITLFRRIFVVAALCAAMARPQPAQANLLPVACGIVVIVVGGYATIQIIDCARHKLNPQGVDQWPKTIYAGTNTPFLQGAYNLVKNRSSVAGGGYYQGPNACVWLCPWGGNLSDKTCSWNWIVTDRYGSLATTMYGFSGMAPGVGVADDWNHGNNNPTATRFTGVTPISGWPNMTNMNPKIIGFTIPAKVKSLSLDPRIELGEIEYLGLNTEMDCGDFDAWMRWYGVDTSTVYLHPQYLWDGGSWGFNNGPANYGTGGGLPGITNSLWLDQSTHTLKLDLSGINGGSICAFFKMDSTWDSGITTNNYRVVFPITITGCAAMSNYRVQKSNDNKTWTTVVNLQIVGDGTVQLWDDYADPTEFYRVVAVAQ